MADSRDTADRPTALQYLGFDFGLKRIGVAVGQSLTHAARPIHTLTARQGQPEWDEVEAIVNEWQPAALIVGLPYNIDGSRQAITDEAQQFADQLEKKFGLPVYCVDERLSSHEASARIRAARREGHAKRKAAAKLDAIAASVILESWLRSLSEKNK